MVIAGLVCQNDVFCNLVHPASVPTRTIKDFSYPQLYGTVSVLPLQRENKFVHPLTHNPGSSVRRGGPGQIWH